MHIGARFNKKLRFGVEGRKDLLSNLEIQFPLLTKGRKIAWFHAASLGEFEQGRPVIEAFRAEYPGYFILLTFFSPSGYEIRKNYDGADYICYLPVDTKSNARRFVQIVKPEIACFIKYEFWFNYLRELRNYHSSIISFSTIFRPGQVFFKFYGGFYRNLLLYFDHILVQNEESVRLLHEMNITKCSIAGDTRFDRVKSIALNIKELPVIERFVDGSSCMVAGSVWEADMEVLIPALNALKQPLKVIVAPHEIHPAEIEIWRKKLSGKSVLYSEFVRDSNGSFDYLIIDNIGMLSALYKYGDMAYIGGSFGSGLHNILEAATFGLPIIFGNKSYHKFQEARDLMERQGASAVADSDEIAKLIAEWIEEPEVRIARGNVSRNYVLEKAGATQKVMRVIGGLLKS